MLRLLTCGLLAISLLCCADASAAPVRLVRDADPGNLAFTRSHFWRVRDFDHGWAYQHATDWHTRRPPGFGG